MIQTVKAAKGRLSRHYTATSRTFTIPPMRVTVEGEVAYWQRSPSTVRAGVTQV